MDEFNDPSQLYDADRPMDSSAASKSHLHDETSDLDLQPFFEIWMSPRRTMRRIVEADPTLHVNLLIAVAGIAEALDRASRKNLGDKSSLGVILFLSFVIAPGMSLIGAWLYSHLIRLSGNWMSGRGNYREIKAAFAWASVPTVVVLVLWIPLILMFGKEMFTEEMPTLQATPALGYVLLSLSFAMIVLGVWALVLLCNTIAEVQEYRSAWKGLANLILAGLIFILPIVLLVLGIVFITKS